MEKGEIIIYQMDDTSKIDVRLENDTVWLTQTQITELFQRDRSVISKHINNIFKEGELDEKSNVQKMHITNSDKPISLYSLDIIISVGYRVKSQRGTQFRIWANKVLKEYMLKGYAVNKRIERLERTVAEHSDKIDFFVRSSLPPVEGIFYDGQIFDAHGFVSDLIRRADRRIILIDNYIDDTILKRLDKRAPGVTATIYTRRISEVLQTDINLHNQQYAAINVLISSKVHDRFLIIDDVIYHIGASIKDLGKKIFAFSRMEENPENLLGRII